MQFETIKQHIETHLEGINLSTDENSTPKAVIISPDHLKSLMEFLHTNDQLYFDMLSCITGVDNGVEANTMEVVYNLYSILFDHHLAVKVVLDRTNPVVSTVSDIWKTADWHEREAFDLLGITFNNHPDLRRILLPANWEGFPLRKDYQHQQEYHGIRVAYDAEDKPKDIPNS